MAVHNELAELLNKQVTVELSAAQRYLQLSYNLEYASWPGTAAHFASLAAEERAHSRAFAELLMDRGHQVVLQQIDGFDGKLGPMLISEPHKAFREALEIERANKIAITTLVEKAIQYLEHDIMGPLQNLLAGQQKEIAELEAQIDVLERIDGDNGALVEFDRNLNSGPQCCDKY